jgi:NAD-dependent dihydropyrimidine dehydrogenase PreA subunit
MSFIITSKCIDVCDGGCLKVCPMDCIHGPINPTGEGKELQEAKQNGVKGIQLYINPNDCIDCSACIPECPVDAIVSSENEAIQLGEYQSVTRNYEFFGLKYLENR